ncbi:MAG TPA: MBL fold metallo-hydrolase [Dehalococcoidia bacterium]|nr:MBL fold metallo-hydrolase [Dehalococcoidia bacterium]
MKTEIYCLSIRMQRYNCYLIKEEGIVMVDAGNSMAVKKLLKTLDSLSINPRDISLLFLTHGHIDHVCSANDFKNLTGCQVAVNYREKDWVEKGLVSVPPGVNPWGKACSALGTVLSPFMKFTGTPVDIPLEDTEYSLESYGIHGRIIHTPGHTSGSMSLLLDTGDAFVGDLAVNGLPLRIGPGMPEVGEDADTIKDNWRLLLSNGVEKIYPGHGKQFDANILRRYL